MPLAFESLSHGTIAFGFFNIDSDMLLLEKSAFCLDLNFVSTSVKWHSLTRCDEDQYRFDN